MTRPPALGLSPASLAELQASKAVITSKLCECGRTIAPKRKHGRFCSDRCRLLAWAVQQSTITFQDAPQHALTQLREAIRPPAGADTVQIACGPKRSLQSQFLAWLDTDEGQRVYVQVLRRALLQREAGKRHGSVSDIYGEIRAAHPELDLNDRYTSRLARLLMERHPELANPPFFETRRLTA